MTPNRKFSLCFQLMPIMASLVLKTLILWEPMHWWFSHRHLFLASGKVLNNPVCILGLAIIICKQPTNELCDLGPTINPFGISYSGCQIPDRPYAEKVLESMVSMGLVIFPGNQ